MLKHNIKFSCNGIEINTLKFNSVTGKIYAGWANTQIELCGPILLSLESRLCAPLQPEVGFPVEITNVRIYSEPAKGGSPWTPEDILLEPIELEDSELSDKHEWEFPLIIRNDKLLGEFPFELILEYQYI